LSFQVVFLLGRDYEPSTRKLPNYIAKRDENELTRRFGTEFAQRTCFRNFALVNSNLLKRGLKIFLEITLSLICFFAALWTLAQTINQRSFLYGFLFLFFAFILVKVITKRAALVLFLTLLSIWFLVQSPPVQTWLVRKIGQELSKSLKTDISIKHVDFAFFDKLILEQVLVEDRSRDTLFYADDVKVLITDWFFLKDSSQLKYIGLNNATIKLQRDDSVWNYQFIVDQFARQKPDTSSKGMSFDLLRLDLSNIHVLKRDGWRGEDMDLNLQSLQMEAEEFDLSKKIGRINFLQFARPEFSMKNYIGKRPPPIDTSLAIKDDPMHLRLNAAGWDIIAKKVTIDNGFFKDDKQTGLQPEKYFDGEHIFFNAINIEAKNLRLNKDTITAAVQLSTTERSGIQVKRLTSDIKFFPEAMEFYKMDLQTNNSHLKNFFAMRFASIDNMSDFVTKIRMEGDFTNADISSDDIAFFAPALKSWKKNIHITGSIRGTVADLNARNIIMTAGRNSLLNGNIRMTGLPDIDKTFIDFKSNDLRTNYADVSTFVPALRQIEQPRLDKIDYLRFTGSFKGYIRDFVTNGTIQTNLGTIVSNVNMKLNSHSASVYSGTMSTDSFNLGVFLDNDQLGIISCSGKINGQGLTAQTLNASIDGTITQFFFDDYLYHSIIVNGTLAKSKFSGQIISSDSNLNATMNGLVDFSKHPYTFNFYADVIKANLAKLHVLKKPLQFNGKLDFNFTGDNIDNFTGIARVYNASILKNGQRISFDSLIVNSSIADNNKTITLESNEFNGAFVGDFSIKNLPAAFQTFLNKYYPTYISPAKSRPSNQDFSFVISTRKVQDYLDLFDKKLKGFDNTSISGRITSKENLLDLNIDVPQFSYNNIVFNNVSIKGRGSLDSLSMQTDIGEITINDSLHFPGTHVHLRSASDLSEVQIQTSANQTLNSASIAAEVQTLPTGIHIKFNPSSFDINSKRWTIDKDGEFTLSTNLVEASNLRIHSDDQQVLVTTHPSSQGNWNDIRIDLKKINLGDITPFFVKSDRIEGLLTGSSEIANPYAQPKISFIGQADQFRLDNDSVGKLQLTGDYDTKTRMVNAHFNSDNKNYHFDVVGLFNTSDSNNIQPVNVNISLSETKIGLLEKYLSGIFSNIKGFATGKLQIAGSGNNLKYLGDIQLHNGELKVIYTQCTYRIPSMNVALRDSSIDFGTFQITDKLDSLRHTAEITEAKLYHHAFTNMRYDFAMNTNRLLLLDTKISDNNLFYGRLIGKASLRFTGPQENMQLYIKGEPTDSSNIYLPLSTTRESSDADFIVWKVYGKEMQVQANDGKSSNITVKLDLTANALANVYVILDPLTGDIIKTNGHGQMHMEVGTTQNLSIRGRYDISQGTYNFNLQSLIRKPFVFKKDADNYISWTGDPYDANINIQAIYEAENVHFSDLGIPTLQSANVKAYRGPVWVIATLQNKLMKPEISFQIELPPNSTIKNDYDAISALQAIENDPGELNKQASLLVAFDQFGPMSNSTATFDAGTAASGIFVNSISGFVSNQLTKQLIAFLRKVDPTLHVNFNASVYNGYNAIAAATVGATDPTRTSYDRTNLNLSVGKSFLNERLTFTLGNAVDVGLSAQQASASPFQFLPNATLEYKLTRDGRVLASIFYRDSYNYTSASHTENSSGASLSYQRSFDHFSELFGKKKKKKEKPKEATPPPAQTNATSSN
jgi:hypothetical protein